MIVGTGVDIVEHRASSGCLSGMGIVFARRFSPRMRSRIAKGFKNKRSGTLHVFCRQGTAFQGPKDRMAKGVRWIDVEVTHQPSGKPIWCSRVRLKNGASAGCNAGGAVRFLTPTASLAT